MGFLLYLSNLHLLEPTDMNKKLSKVDGGVGGGHLLISLSPALTEASEDQLLL
jgi:hypothetical protein